jgi:cell division protein FtsX
VVSAAIGIGVNAVVFGFIAHLVDPAMMPNADPAEWQSRIDIIRILLVTVAAFVFVIAAASVTGLMLSRAASRVHETSVRVALGAHGRTLVKPLLTEGLLVAVTSTLLGILAAFWTVHGLPALFYAEDIEALPIVIDWPGVGIASLLGVSVVCACALAPMLWTSRSRPAPDSRGTGPGLANTFGGWRSSIVIVQLTLCLVMLISTAGVVAHMRAALKTDFAERTGDAIVVRIERISALPEFIDALRTVVGDAPVAIVHALPGGHFGTLSLIADATAGNGPDTLTLGVNVIDGEHLTLSGLTLSGGRTFDAGDRVKSRPVALVNEEAAALIRSTDRPNPLGTTLVDPAGRSFEIVGLVREAPFRTLQPRARPTVYLPYRQHYPSSVFLVAGGGARWTPETLARVEASLAAVGKGRVTSVTTLQHHLQWTAEPADRLVTTVVELFAGLAMLLSMIGVSGVTSDAVARRKSEIALRMALGAPRWRIAGGVFVYGLRLAMTGAVAGVTVCLVGFRVLPPLPDGSRGPALWVWCAAIAGLGLLVVSGALMPARRALAVDPSRLLRE